MKITAITLVYVTVLILCSCQQEEKQEALHQTYFDVSKSDSLNESSLVAITDEEFLQYGARVAYVNLKGDTIIPFGNYAYYGTDTLIHYANVLEHPNDSTYGRSIGINRDQKILFDLVTFDNGPDPFHEELTRVIRNGKMGYADKYGKVVIPCMYAYAKWFDNGEAEVTFNAVEYTDGDEHRKVESDEWFKIDRKGNKIKNSP